MPTYQGAGCTTTLARLAMCCRDTSSTSASSEYSYGTPSLGLLVNVSGNVALLRQRGLLPRDGRIGTRIVLAAPDELPLFFGKLFADKRGRRPQAAYASSSTSPAAPHRRAKQVARSHGPAERHASRHGAGHRGDSSKRHVDTEVGAAVRSDAERARDPSRYGTAHPAPALVRPRA